MQLLATNDDLIKDCCFVETLEGTVEVASVAHVVHAGAGGALTAVAHVHIADRVEVVLKGWK